MTMKYKDFNLRLSTICLILCLTLFGWVVPLPAQQAKERIVTGTITDENNEPMIGVSVLVVGTSTATMADNDGRFSVRVPEGKNELQLSFIGYETTIILIPADN